MSNNHFIHTAHLNKKTRQNQYGFEDQQQPYFLQEQSKVDGEEGRSHGKEKNKQKVQNGHYKANHQFEGNRLVQKHLRLKRELKDLMNMAEQISEQKKNGGKRELTQEEEQQKISDFQKEIRQSEVKIQRNKTQLGKLKKALGEHFDMKKITQKQTELKNIKKQITRLEEEKNKLEAKKKKNQKELRNDQYKEDNGYIEKLQQELQGLAEKSKKQMEFIRQRQRQIQKIQENYMGKGTQSQRKKQWEDERSRQISRQKINEQVIMSLEEEIKSLEMHRIQTQKHGNEKIRALQRERKQLRIEIDRKKLLLEEREQEQRLSKIRNKDYTRMRSHIRNPNSQQKL